MLAEDLLPDSEEVVLPADSILCSVADRRILETEEALEQELPEMVRLAVAVIAAVSALL